MSIRACDQVWRRAKAKGSALLLLLAIADCANDEGTHAYPSIATLADKTRLTQRQIINLVQQLEASGELTVQRPKVRRTGLANVYTLHVGDLNSTGAKISPEKTSREIAAAMGEAGYSTTVLIEPSGVHSTEVEAQRIWANAVDTLRSRNYPAPGMNMLAELPVRMDGAVLVVRCSPEIAAQWGGYLKQALGDRAVRFVR